MPGSLAVSIGADITGLISGLNTASASLSKFGKDLDSQVTRKLELLAVAAATAGAALTIHLITTGLELIDTNAKLARSLDSTYTGLRAVQLAAADAGVSGEVLKTVLEKFNTKLGEAQLGSKKASDSLALVGLNANELLSLDLDQRIATIADRFKELGMTNQQISAQLKDMGIKNVNSEMVELFSQGGDAIRSAKEELVSYGVSVNKVDSTKVEMANDAFDRLKIITEGVSTQLAIQLAPIILKVSELITQAAADGHGFGDSIAKGIDIAVVALGFLGDTFRGIEIIVKTIQLAFAGFMWVLADGLNGIVMQFRAIANVIPGINIGPFEKMQIAADVTSETVDRLKAELNDLLMSKMPSDKLEQFVADARKAADDAAKEVANKPKPSPTFTPVSEEDAANAEKLRKQQEALLKQQEQYRLHLADKLGELVQSHSSEAEIEQIHYGNQLATLNEAFNAKAISIQDFQLWEQALNADHQAKLVSIEQTAADKRNALAKAEADAKRAILMGVLGNLASLMMSGSKEAFEIGKVASISTAAVKGAEAIQSAWAAGMSVGGPFAPAVAAAYATTAAISSASQIMNIKNQTFGGGARSPTPAGTPSMAPVTGGNPSGGGNAGGGDRSFTIQGLSASSLYSGASLQSLLMAIEEAAGDGRTRIVIS